MQGESPDNRNWYVVTAKPRTEKAVSRRMTECGIEHLLPLQRRLRQWHDRKKWVEVPLFFSYIFVKMAADGRSKVFEADGCLKYVFIGGQIAVLREEEIERVRRLCSYTGEVTISPREPFAEGDEVVIAEGHFAGLHGRLVQSAGKNRLKISIAALHCEATVEINGDMVQKAL